MSSPPPPARPAGPHAPIMPRAEPKAPPAPAVSSVSTTSSSSPTTKPTAATIKASAAIAYPFWFGGSASSMAAVVTHPLDLVKVRLQTQVVPPGGVHRNMVQMFGHVVQTGGIQGLYKGISASLLRQMTYSTARFGVYEHLKQSLTSSSTSSSSSSSSSSPTSQPSLPTLIAIASFSGIIGGLAGNPADVLNVRMQHDASLPVSQRRNYKNVVDGILKMSQSEGIASLFRGLVPNCARAALMTTSQLATYDYFKSVLRSGLGMADGLTTHFTASFMAGFVATTVCSPFDVIKTRIMSASSASTSASTSTTGETTRQSLRSVVAAVYRAEGLRWMFRGWVPSFVRLGPQTVCTFVFLEQHKKAYRWMSSQSSE